MLRFHPNSSAAIMSSFVLVVSLLSTGCSNDQPPGDRPPSPVRVAPVRKEPVAIETILSGTIVPVDISEVASAVAGKVDAFPFEEGALVPKGEPLAQLRTVQLKFQIAAAEATMREKKAHHELLEAGFRREEKDQAKARMLAAEADDKYMQAKLARTRDLHRKGSVSDDELGQTISLAIVAAQQYAAAKADHTLKQAGHRAEEIAEAKAAFESQQQEVLRLHDRLTKYTIVAPFDGILVKQHTDVGQWVEVGGSVATLTGHTQVDVVVHVEESFVSMLRVGQSVDVWIDSLGEEKIIGQIKYIVSRSDWQGGSRSFPVKIRLENRLVEGVPRLKEGMLARVLLRGQKKNRLLAHKDAIVRSSGTPMVYVVGEDNKVRKVQITEGISSGQFIEVIGKLEAGDRLVTEGAERLRPFQEVSILP